MTAHMNTRLSQTENRDSREEVFHLLMNHWPSMDDRQQRTRLAWLVGRLDEESLNALRIRLSKEAKQ
jgi:hypothetical protein